MLILSIPRAADGIRTHDLFLTKEVLYQLSYSSVTVPKRAMGFEPTTSCLEGRNSTAELHPHRFWFPVVSEWAERDSNPRRCKTARFTVWCNRPLCHPPVWPANRRRPQSYRWESNPQPTVYKTVALPLCYGSEPPGNDYHTPPLRGRQDSAHRSSRDFTPAANPGGGRGAPGPRFSSAADWGPG